MAPSSGATLADSWEIRSINDAEARGAIPTRRRFFNLLFSVQGKSDCVFSVAVSHIACGSRVLGTCQRGDRAAELISNSSRGLPSSAPQTLVAQNSEETHNDQYAQNRY